MGVLASYQAATDTSLAGRRGMPCCCSHLASLTPQAAHGRKTVFLPLGGDGSPGFPLAILWQNPSGEEKGHLTDVRRH